MTSPSPRIVRVGPDLLRAAVLRLVGDRAAAQQAGGGRGSAPAAIRAEAARRFLDSARSLGIDLGCLWATIDDAADPPTIGEVCLAVPGSGRTANIFLSTAPPPPPPAPRRRAAEPPPNGPAGTRAHADRVALVNEACRVLAASGAGPGRGTRLAQALLEPDEQPAAAALAAAGFIRLGDLEYLQRALPRSSPPRAEDLGGGFRLRSIKALGNLDALAQALESSYVDTLDCPELSGLRDIADVIDSHRAVGRHDPALWWVLFESAGGEPQRPAGCLLLNPVPETESVELVYLGLAPRVRGRGLGRAMLEFGLARVAGGRWRWITCAVDTRNTPALELYRRAGFERFSRRLPMVRRLVP
jgi:ribosomal protein S18 acetylase RimI-like enzyme